MSGRVGSHIHEGLLPSHALGSLNPPEFPDSQATEDGCFWKFSHALGFVTGGIFFLIGTSLYFPSIQDEEIVEEAAGSDSSL